jgi:hypothetical protein
MIPTPFVSERIPLIAMAATTPRSRSSVTLLRSLEEPR